jgi:hypothetical protein
MVVDRERLQWAESAEEKRDRIDVDGVKRLPETYGAEHDIVAPPRKAIPARSKR